MHAAYDHARKNDVDAKLYYDKDDNHYVTLGVVDLKSLPKAADTADTNGFYFIFNKLGINDGNGIITAIPVYIDTILVSDSRGISSEDADNSPSV